MAGIITNVDSDVQKLRKLKNEIEEVKKALKGINIKVDVDIAKGMEAQLKSLTDQYNALVMKVAEAEGKILLSTKRINDASEKIIQAQEKVSKAAGIPTNTGNTNSQGVNAAETASVQSQAKAYQDLEAEINGILGTREANVKRMVDEMNAIRLINVEIKKITKSQGESSSLSSAQQKRLEQLNNSLLTHKTALSEVRQTLSNNVKLDNVAVTSMNGLSQSLSRMRIAYRELTEEERKSPIGKELLASINQADIKIKELDATLGNHQRNVGDYASGFNGLGMSVQQIVRELPAAKMGINMFFLAISNNIPIMVDEIKRATAANELLKKSGQTSVPVWKQVASSLLSWQTGMMVGITLLTMYGKDIVNWVGSLFNANEVLKETKRFQDALNQSMRDANKDIIDETTKLKILYRAATDAKKSIEERTIAVRELKKEFPSYFGLMDDEEIKAGKAADAYKLLTDSIIASVKARRTEKLIVSEQNKYLDYLGETTNAYMRVQEAQERANKANIALEESATDYNVQEYKDAFNDLRKTQDEYNKARAKSQKQAENVYNLTTTTNASKLYGSQKERDKATIENKDFWTEQKNIAEKALNDIASKQKKLMDAGKFEGIPSDVIEQYKKAIKLRDEADKALKIYESKDKQENQANKLREQQEKLSLLLNKQALEQKRATEDLQTQTDQARIDAMREGSIRTLEQMQLDHKKEMQQLERQQEDILRKKIEDKKAEFDAGEDEKATKDSKYKRQTFDGRDITLTQSEKDTFANQKMYLDLKQVAETQAYLDKERQTWNDYLAEYGTFQEKKEAIAVEYINKIAKASTEGEKASLKKESENKIKEVNFEELKSSINFADIFGNLDSQSTEAITRMRDKLKEIINKSAKDLKPTDLKALQDAFKDIELKISERNPFGELKQGADDYKNATQAVIKAQEDLNIVQQGGEVIIGTYIDKTGKLCTKLLTQEQAEKNLSDAQMKRLESQGKLTKAVNSIGQQGQQLVNAGNNLVDMLTNLGVEVPESISGALAGLGQIMSGLESIDLTKPFSVISSTTGILSGFVQTITSFFGGPNGTSYYEGVKEQLEAINEVYDRIINKSREEITFGGGFASVQASTQALDNYYKKVANLQTIADASGRAGASWKSHSAEWHSNKNVGAGNFEQMSQILGKSIQSMDDLYYLTGDELYLIQSQLPEAWSQIDSRIKENLQSIIDCKDEANELRDALNQAMTGIDFDSFYSGFIDQLSDIDTSFEDMCDNFEGYLRKSIMAGLVASQYQGRIENLYQEWSDAARSDNKITEDEADALQDRYKQIVSDMMKDREEMFNSFGWDSGSSSQESTKKGFATASQDSIDELNGRFTAGQIAWEETKNQNILQSQSLNILTVKADSILSINTDTRNIADEIRTIQANSFLELQGIRENTGAIIKPIKDIAADIAEVKKNISKL